MPLSEQEQRALAELEAQLSAEDPKFASAMLADPNRARRRARALLGGVAMLAGLAIVLVAVWLPLVWVSIVGFALMVVGANIAFSPGRLARSTASVHGPQLHVVGGASRAHGFGAAASRPGGAPSRRSASSPFMTRLEERWERRRRENQGW